MKHVSRFIWALFCLTVLTPFAWAQSTFATITGVTTDQSGAVVPGVTVEARNLKTSYVYTAVSNGEGVYTLANLLDGTYQLKARANGFADYTVENLELVVRDQRRVDIKLQVGGVGASVEVTAGGGALIETETGRIADIKDRELLRGLPLTLRRVTDYYAQAPQTARLTSGFGFSLAGSRNQQAETSIDGTTISRSDGSISSGPLTEKTEGFQELRMDLSGNSAEFGVIGQVNVTSRAGTNELHGVFSDYYTSPFMIARNPFATSNTGSVRHRFTASLGGPVFIPKVYDGRNKTFFFGTLEWHAGSPNLTNLTQNVPLAAWRQGDFSGVSGLTLRNPFDGNRPFAGNRLPANLINPVSRNIQEKFYALPNFGDPNVFAAQNYREVRSDALHWQPTLNARMDHRFNDRAFIYGRLTKVDWLLDSPESIPLIKTERSRSRQLRAATLAYTHTLRPTLINEARWGFSYDNLPVESRVNGKALAQELGLRGLAPDLPDAGGIPRISFTGVGISALAVDQACNPCGQDRMIQFTDHVTWLKGAHTVKMGGELRWGRLRDFRQGADLFGNANFTNRFTGHPYADFLLGVPTQVRRDFPTVELDRRLKTWAGFISDEWKASQKLTVTMGLRYQLYGGYTEQNGRLAMFDPQSRNIVVPDGSLSKVSPLLPKNYVNVVEASQLGLPGETLIRRDTNNFAPRLSVAWRPFGVNTVIRAAAGLYYDNVPTSPANGAVIPYVISEPVFVNPTTNPAVIFPNIFPATSTGGPTTVTIPAAARRDLRIPRSGQYTLTIEHQRWDTGFRATYTGTNTRQGVYRYDINQPVADARLYTEKPRPFPNYPGINFTDNGAGHQYNALSVEVERKMKHGVRFQTYYTFARDIGDLDGGESPEDAFNRARERSVNSIPPTHRFGFNSIFELPFGRKRAFLTNLPKVADAALGGWVLAVIYNKDSGNFLTPLWTGPDPTGTRFTNSGRPNVTLRPDQLRDARLDNPTLSRWFDVGAFAAPPVGRFGTSAKGVIVAPGVNVMHASVAKQFTIRERALLRLEFLGTNVLNHPNYFTPGLNIAQAGTAGVITSVVTRNNSLDSGIPREMQMQLRIEW